MAQDEIQNGQAEHGTVHVMEEEMRAAKQGVFESPLTEAEVKRRKSAAASASTKMEAAPSNKSEPKPISSEGVTTAASKRKG